MNPVTMPAPMASTQLATEATYTSEINNVFSHAFTQEEAAGNGYFSSEQTALRWAKRFALSPIYGPRVREAIAARGGSLDWRALIELVFSVLSKIPAIGMFVSIAQAIFELLFPAPTPAA